MHGFRKRKIRSASSRIHEIWNQAIAFCFVGHVPAGARRDEEFQPDRSQERQDSHFVFVNTSLHYSEPASPEHLTTVQYTFIARSVPVFNIKFRKNWPSFMANNCETFVKIHVFEGYNIQIENYIRILSYAPFQCKLPTVCSRILISKSYWNLLLKTSQKYKIYEGRSESKERFAIQRYLLIRGKKQNMQVLSHTFTYFPHSHLGYWGICRTVTPVYLFPPRTRRLR
jgi:hypothetical protein